MYSLLLSLIAGAIFGFLIVLLTSYTGFGIFAGIIIFAILFVFLTRHFSGKLRDIFTAANAELQKQKNDSAIEILNSGFVYKRWAFLVGAQINSQIGMIMYTQRKFGEAYKHLQQSNPRIFLPYAMFAIGQIKNNKKEQAKNTLDLLMKFNKKEAFVYSLSAYLYEEQYKDKEGAVKVIQRGLKYLPHNQNLNEHLLALQNNKSYKMEKYGDMWYQMMLEKKGMHKLQQKYMKQRQRQMGVKKSMYR